MSASDNSCSSSLYSYTKQCMFSVVSLSSGRHFAGQMILTFQERLRPCPKFASPAGCWSFIRKHGIHPRDDSLISFSLLQIVENSPPGFHLVSNLIQNMESGLETIFSFLRKYEDGGVEGLKLLADAGNWFHD
ncbi:hypothetical protein NC651_000942 [Populus alba x Populus x berolinensis]|nr:hypothetical protein NC651_000942 [Populus alba x Populus x berolinensis]